MIKLLAVAGTAAALCLAAPTAAFASGTDQSLAQGAVTELVSGGNWHVSFDIQDRARGGNSSIMVHNRVEDFSFNGALCSGIYRDPIHRGTSVYAVGRRTSYRGSGADREPFYAFKIHQNGPSSADYSWVDVGLSSMNAARGACADPARTLSAAYYPLASAHVTFHPGRHHH
jgi:hypothetical protein